MRLTGAAVTREAAPMKARAVAVNFILMVVDTSCSVVVGLPSQCRGMKKKGWEDIASRPIFTRSA